MRHTYLIMTDDNRSVTVKASEIEKLEKPKDAGYQIAGVNPKDQSKVNIQDTPFDLNQEK